MFLKVFKMPSGIKITGRSSSITNAFVSSLIPIIKPTSAEIKRALEILKISPENLTCVFCGDPSTEWDHLHPLVVNQKPTGYISEIRNLVPACGKCNQSKGNKDWKVWMLSSAPRSPKTRSIKDLALKINRLEEFEKFMALEPINLESLTEKKAWDEHWNNWKNILEHMKRSQALASKINSDITEGFIKNNKSSS